MNGIIVIDKPTDFTSFDVVAVVRGILHEKKLGHSGTLDPMATGVLPVLVGRAAKAQSLLPDTDKQYTAAFRLGITTDTLDITGQVLSETKSSAQAEDVLMALVPLRGDIMQRPPMYSAVQKNGVRLYELARKGIEVEREARPVHIGELRLLSFDSASQSGTLHISCSKGTYVRVICEDIGSFLGCGCVMTSLRRTAACGFGESDAVTLDELKRLADEDRIAQVLRPTDSLFECYPGIHISEGQTFRYKNGGGLSLERLRSLKNACDGDILRVYGADGEFLGLGEVSTEKAELTVKKRFCD